MDAVNNITVSCPTCDKDVIWDSKNKYRPFCSDRCKLIDLGEWADEGRKIPGDPIHNHGDDYDPFLQ